MHGRSWGCGRCEVLSLNGYWIVKQNQIKIMSKKKINWLLILQGWAMLWVVIGHAFLGKSGEGPEWENALFHFAYSFHMPLFMLVSGWLFYLTRLKAYSPIWGGQKLVGSEWFLDEPGGKAERAACESGSSVNGYQLLKKWSYWDVVKDKAIRLLMPGLVFSLISFALKLAFPGEISRQVGLNMNDVVHALLYPYDNPFREFWFIATLFWFFLMTPLWKAALSNAWAKWGMLAVLAVLHFWHPDVELLCIGRAFSFAIWFYLGLLISEENLVNKYLWGWIWLTLAAGIAIYVAGMFTHPFVTTCGGIVSSFGLALIADRYIPKLFFGFRNYTYQIFLMGILAQMFVKILYRHISVPYFAAYIVCILAGLYVPVVASKIIEKLGWKPLKLCVGLK